MITKVYIDTSIAGGYFDDEFSNDTKALFKRLENKEIIFMISSVLKHELQKAPDNVQKLLDRYEPSCFEYVELTEEAIELADKYVAEKVVGKSSIVSQFNDWEKMTIIKVCIAWILKNG